MDKLTYIWLIGLAEATLEALRALAAWDQARWVEAEKSLQEMIDNLKHESNPKAAELSITDENSEEALSVRTTVQPEVAPKPLEGREY